MHTPVFSLSGQKKSYIVTIFLIFLLIFLSSCSRVVVQPLLNPLTHSLEMQTDLELLEDGAPSLLLILDGLIVNDPDNVELLIVGTRAYSSFAQVMSADGQMDRAVGSSEKAREYGQALLNLLTKANDSIRTPQADSITMPSLFSKNDVPALFWGAYGWAVWVKYQAGSPAALIQLPGIERIMFRVVELDESYYHGAAHAVLGSYYGSRPEMLGGDFDKSRMHFERALELAGRRFLLTQVAYAETYARMTMDRELFAGLLNEVLAHPLVKDDLAASNQLAKSEAQKLLVRMDDLF